MKLSNIILSEDKEDVYLINLANKFAEKFPNLSFDLKFPGSEHKNRCKRYSTRFIGFW